MGLIKKLRDALSEEYTGRVIKKGREERAIYYDIETDDSTLHVATRDQRWGLARIGQEVRVRISKISKIIPLEFREDTPYYDIVRINVIDPKP